MSFLTQLQKNTNKSTYTENGALTNRSTLDPVLDYFSRAGAMRSDVTGAVSLFKKAFNADPQLAVRCLFYLRDIRGGAGERKVFQETLKSLDKELLLKVVGYVPEYGRFDDIPVVEETAEILYDQFILDEQNMIKGESISLLAKWLPSENASSKETIRKARSLMSFWDMAPKQYRKRVSALRKYIGLLEQKMSSREWSNIDYSKLPSQAHRKHVKAFSKHDEIGYAEYLQAVEKGEKKINAGTLMTYEIYDELFKGYRRERPTKAVLDAMTALWNALPDYTNDTNALVLADVSGSMTGRPMSVSTTLAVYFAERNKGRFANTYMTFTNRPSVVTIQGGDLFDKLNFVEHHDVGYNTDLAAAFDAILRAAVEAKCTQEEMPAVLYIISDMQFDSQMSNSSETNFETAQRKFKEAGYELPHVVFWNVNARQESPATKYDDKVTLISGSNQSAFKYAVEHKSAVELMHEVLNGPRYEQIVL
jgi:hypothetical protein